jgi:hypothetical protein
MQWPVPIDCEFYTVRRSLLGSLITVLSLMTVSLKTVSLMTVRLMTVGLMTVSLMTVSLNITIL